MLSGVNSIGKLNLNLFGPERINGSDFSMSPTLIPKNLISSFKLFGFIEFPFKK